MSLSMRHKFASDPYERVRRHLEHLAHPEKNLYLRNGDYLERGNTKAQLVI